MPGEARVASAKKGLSEGASGGGTCAVAPLPSSGSGQAGCRAAHVAARRSVGGRGRAWERVGGRGRGAWEGSEGCATAHNQPVRTGVLAHAGEKAVRAATRA